MGQVALITSLEHFLFFGDLSQLPNAKELLKAEILELMVSSISEDGLTVNILFIWSDTKGEINETYSWVKLKEPYQLIEDFYAKNKAVLPPVERRRRRIR